MVPLELERIDVGARLPRARGDGPVIVVVPTAEMRSPPRARGWSLGRWDDARWHLVSPARAGMVPVAPFAQSLPARLPRARGDGPAGTSVYFVPLESPPRARGWSRAIAAEVVEAVVSPARAGMVPDRAQ